MPKLWKEGCPMIFRCWRCGDWGWKIRHVCGPCWKANM